MGTTGIIPFLPASAPAVSPRACGARSRSALVLILLLVALPGVGRAEESREKLTLSLGSVRVDYLPGDARLARQAADAVEKACGRIARELGAPCPRPIRVGVVRGRDGLNRHAGRHMRGWVLAAAFPDRDTIVVDARRATPVTANDMRLVIAHETVHLALARTEEGREDRLPLWFHEGVATWFSGQRYVHLSRRTFDLAAAQGALIPLDDLAQRFPDDATEAALAYLESEAFIVHIVATYPPEALRWVLDRYRQGEAFETAFRNALGVSRAALENRWAHSLRKRFPWMRLLWEATTLFGVLAIVTILIYLIVRRRGRRQHRLWEEEERLWTVVTAEDKDDEPGDDGQP